MEFFPKTVLHLHKKTQIPNDVIVMEKIEKVHPEIEFVVE